MYKMFGLTKRVFIRLLTGPVNASNHTKFVSLSNQKCEIQTTLLTYILKNTVKSFPTIHWLDRCVGSFNTPNDLSSKVCIPIKTEDSNLRVFNMITGINESNALTQHVSCKCKCKFDRR